MFEKIVEIGLLFDFYGKLLSSKQYMAIELYYIHDLSLSEIGEQMDISRQGVHDLIKRGESKLYNYEDTLGLVEKFDGKKRKVEKILKFVNRIEEENSTKSDKVQDYIDLIKDIAMEILK
ncbi:YlxM family DNA-binding protein [Sporosalibacterium faouarense]|uniref:YlxM family DNA-binding protein n=1 Tax=Sporosalibacterium faouarense TaxID=516123 RepID=UPI00141D0827|nr:sigma factor-like helix-turn-helix DNA-binding protein [Sporosalibacterium faouarense]MTI47689.1 DNA-binding protein [Bacillota bacterium]